MSFVAESERGFAAAREARLRLGLGLEAPLADALVAIEDLAGVPVTVLTLPEGLAGLQGCKRGRSYVFVNGAETVVRQRFTLAHEFGHIELGHSGSVDYAADVFGEGHRPPAEVQADGFAAEFLAPVDGVRRWLALLGEPATDLHTVVQLANYFHISAEAALYRLQAARRLTKGKYEPIKDQIRGSEHTALARRLGLEEVDDMLHRASGQLPRLPRMVMTQAAHAYERGLLSVAQIAQLLEVDPDRVRSEFERRGIKAGYHETDY